MKMMEGRKMELWMQKPRVGGNFWLERNGVRELPTNVELQRPNKLL